MALLAIAVPILPGKTGDWRRFSDELNGQLRAEYSASRQRLGVRERVYLQTLPQGDVAIVTLEGDDPEGAFRSLGQGNDEFTRWFVQQVKEIHGLDLRRPLPELPRMILDTLAGGPRPAQSQLDLWDSDFFGI